MNCCRECFRDRGIRLYLQENGGEGQCDFCGSEDVEVMPASEVGGFIEDRLGLMYEDPAESTPYESAEGGYQFVGEQPTDYHEVVCCEREIFSHLIDDPTDLLDALGLSTDQVVRIDQFGPLSGGREQIETWESFKRKVQSEFRYTILGSPDFQTFFDEIRSVLDRWTVVRWEPGARIYRARIPPPGVDYRRHDDLKAPPLEKAGQGRMNPKGISFFYGTSHPQTALQEVRPIRGDVVTVGTFAVLRPLKLVDLTAIPDSSLFADDFDFDYDQYYWPFLLHFAADISRPVKSDRTDMDYLATQAFVELLKVHGLPAAGQIDGLIFSSSLHAKGKCLVLFGGPEISAEEEDHPTARLLFRGCERYSVESIDVVAKVMGDMAPGHGPT